MLMAGFDQSKPCMMDQPIYSWQRLSLPQGLGKKGIWQGRLNVNVGKKPRMNDSHKDAALHPSQHSEASNPIWAWRDINRAMLKGGGLAEPTAWPAEPWHCTRACALNQPHTLTRSPAPDRLFWSHAFHACRVWSSEWKSWLWAPPFWVILV